MHQPIAVVRTVPRPIGRSIAALLAITLALAATSIAAPVRAAGGDGLRQAANGYRTDHGLNPVFGTALLDDIATKRAAQMVAADQLEHNLDYVFDRLNASGVCWQRFGEIIAWERGYADYSYERTMQMWWNSPTHRDVMMGADYNAAGGAWKAHVEDNAHYSVMIFAELCSDVAGATVAMLKPDRRYNPDRPMVFRPGSYTGYRLGAGGEVLGQKSVQFRATHRPTSAGRTLANGRAWLKVSSGPLAGYWVHESANSYVRGTTTRYAYVPWAQLVVKSGKYTVFKFDWLGGPTAQKVIRPSATVELQASLKAIISGRPFYLVSSGPLEGFWLRDSYNVSVH